MTGRLRKFLVQTEFVLRSNLAGWFAVLAGMILFLVGLVDFLGALSQTQSLNLVDPFFGESFRTIMLVLGFLQCAIAFIVLFTRWQNLKLGLIVWIAINFLIYRAGLWKIGWHHSSGFMFQSFGLSPRNMDILLSCSSVFLFFGGFATLVFQRAAQMKIEFLKMFCPSCGGHIRFATTNLGQEAACPHCKMTVTLRKPEESLKTFCYFCKGNIEFPAHALGQKIACPHCRMDITLKCHTPEIIREANVPLSL
jgi:hypothetical protein